MERIVTSQSSQDTLLLPSNSGQAQEAGQNPPEAPSAKACPRGSLLTARVNSPLPQSSRRVWDPQGARPDAGNSSHTGVCSLPPPSWKATTGAGKPGPSRVTSCHARLACMAASDRAGRHSLSHRPKVFPTIPAPQLSPVHLCPPYDRLTVSPNVKRAGSRSSWRAYGITALPWLS